MLSIGAIAQKIFGSSNERRLKPYRRRVEEINALEAEVAKLSDEALRARTVDFRNQVAEDTEFALRGVEFMHYKGDDSCWYQAAVHGCEEGMQFDIAQYPTAEDHVKGPLLL